MCSQESHAVVLPSDDNYLGVFPELQADDLVLLRCQYCDKLLLPNVLKNHIESCPSRKNMHEKTISSSIDTYRQPIVKAPRYKSESPQIYSENADTVPCKFCGFRVKLSHLNAHFEKVHRFSSPSISSLPTVNSSALSEVDTSSTNSSPIWESDKNNTYDSLSSSSSNSVNIVRLNSERHKFVPKDIVIPVQIMPGNCRSSETTQEPVISSEKPSPAQLSTLPNPKISNAALPVSTKSSVSAACATPETPVKYRSFLQTIEPSSSFVTESSSEIGKTPKLIIRKIQPQTQNDLRRIAPYKGVKENSNSDNLRCFLLTKGQGRPQSVKPSKHHQIKKKLHDPSKVKESIIDERDEYLRASEQQISILTGRIEMLNGQIEKLTGQVGPLRLENEEYKAEIRNLRSRVEELENSTTTLIEQRNLRAKHDREMEKLKQTWDRERFHFTKRLEEMKTELSDYKNSSTLEKQKLTILNAYLERKYGLQEALSDSLQKEKEILERHLPPGVHYRLAMNELGEIQSRRSVIYSLLNDQMDCHISPPQTIPQASRGGRQIIDMNDYIPVDNTEMLQGNGQMMGVYNFDDTKMQYQGYSTEATDMSEVMNLKADCNSSNKGADMS